MTGDTIKVVVYSEDVGVTMIEERSDMMMMVVLVPTLTHDRKERIISVDTVSLI